MRLNFLFYFILIFPFDTLFQNNCCQGMFSKRYVTLIRQKEKERRRIMARHRLNWNQAKANLHSRTRQTINSQSEQSIQNEGRHHFFAIARTALGGGNFDNSAPLSLTVCLILSTMISFGEHFLENILAFLSLQIW